MIDKDIDQMSNTELTNTAFSLISFLINSLTERVALLERQITELRGHWTGLET